MGANISKLQELEKEFQLSYKDIDLVEIEIDKIRHHWLGRKGKLAEQYSLLRSLPSKERPEYGKQLNIIKNKIENKIEELQTKATLNHINNLIKYKNIDVTLPVDTSFGGSLHPVTLVRRRVYELFKRQGFVLYEGPELEFDDFNFTYLNIPKDHPSRDMQDTFFIKNIKNTVLRTHTSNVQIHAMLKEKILH